MKLQLIFHGYWFSQCIDAFFLYSNIDVSICYSSKSLTRPRRRFYTGCFYLQQDESQNRAATLQQMFKKMSSTNLYNYETISATFLWYHEKMQ